MDQTAGAPTRVYGPLEESFSQGPILISGNSACPNVPKYHSFPWHFSDVAPIGTNTNPGSAWVVLDTVNAQHVAQVQFYVEALGTSGASQIFYYLELEVEFKMRT
jgi:hypothetical protein